MSGDVQSQRPAVLATTTRTCRAVRVALASSAVGPAIGSVSGPRDVVDHQRSVRELTPVRVVICDGSTEVRSAIHAVVTSRPGYEVVAQASDADGAWEAISRTEPDVVIFDAWMPGPVVAVVDQVAAQPDPPRIVIFSAAISGRVRRDLLAAGADACVVKTGRIGPLLTALERAERTQDRGVSTPQERGGRRSAGSIATWRAAS